jgi:hypothetical protein
MANKCEVRVLSFDARVVRDLDSNGNCSPMRTKSTALANERSFGGSKLIVMQENGHARSFYKFMLLSFGENDCSLSWPVAYSLIVDDKYSFSSCISVFVSILFLSWIVRANF